jgi:hypothetical protein
MLIHPTVERLRALGLTAMADAFIAALLMIGVPFGAQASAVDATNTPQTFVQLGGAASCSSTHVGSRATITDGPASPSWNVPVTTGGGHSTVAIYCDGTTWKVSAGGGATPVSVVLTPPSTNQGNYATGCSGATCLTFDDHWTTANLQNGALGTTKYWFEGMFVCNNNGLQNCGADTFDGATTLQYPFSTFGMNSGINGVFTGAPYGSPATNLTGASAPLSKATDGTLQFTLSANTWVNTQGSYCSGPSCGSSKWVSGAITSGGLNPNATTYPSTIANTTAIIPAAGGIVQWRMKLDNGVSFGAYPGMECDGVGTNLTTKGNAAPNANFEFGYNYSAYTGNALTAVAFGMNNTAVSSFGGTGFFGVTTGDDGVGGGDVRNWHKYALEWTGTAWQYYVDGVLRQGAISEAGQAATPNLGFQCYWFLGAAESSFSSFHTVWDSAAHPGPYHTWISDIQFYKKPGT